MAQRFQKKSIIHYTLYIIKNYIALILYILYVVNRSEKKYFKVIQQNGHNLARYVHKRVQVIGAPSPHSNIKYIIYYSKNCNQVYKIEYGINNQSYYYKLNNF